MAAVWSCGALVWAKGMHAHVAPEDKILHCLKAITKNRNVHAGLCPLHSNACTYCSRSVQNVVSVLYILDPPEQLSFSYHL